jgi:hypothetical protein
VRRSHLQVIWLLLGGTATSEVARVTGFSRRWIEKLIHRWNADGLGTSSGDSIFNLDSPDRWLAVADDGSTKGVGPQVGP